MRDLTRAQAERYLSNLAEMERFARVQLAEADDFMDRTKAEQALRHAVGLRKNLEAWPVQA